MSTQAGGRRRARSTVAVDYTAAAGHAPGVGRYVREVVRALVRLDDEEDAPQLDLVELGRAPRPMAGPPLGLEGVDVRSPFRHRQLRLPRRVVSALAALPGAPGALVVRGAGLLHRVQPSWPPAGRHPVSLAIAELPARGSAADHALGVACRLARGVIVFSSDAVEQLTARYGVAPERVHFAPVGSEHWERSLAAAGSAPADGARERRATRDVLVLGAIRASRRPLDVLRAFEALASSGEMARLLLVGRRGDAAPDFEAALRASPAAGRVRWIEEPDEARMPECVADASVLLHLSIHEASPVTPLEATRLGVPVVATPLPAFREALDGTARWVDADDPAGVADALREALDEASDPVTAGRLRRVAHRYTWEACAHAHRAAWRIMLATSRPND